MIMWCHDCLAGMIRFKGGTEDSYFIGVTVRPRWPLAELPALRRMND